MRTHGWGGSLPKDEAEAIARIRRATHECVAEYGTEASISHVAQRLGVSRQTVYRYFPSTNELVMAAAMDGTQSFLTKLGKRLARIHDPGQAVVEAIAATVEAVPKEPYLRLLLGFSGNTALVRGVTGKDAREVGRALLEHTGVDWDAAGVSPDLLDELAEWTLRVLQSFLLDSGEPPRNGMQLRVFLHRWMAPVLCLPPSAMRARE
jgi:AcrR family transcriptional regulator